jgi:hypothetical protein
VNGSESDDTPRARAGRILDVLPASPVLVGGLCLLLTALVDLIVTHEHGISGDEPFYIAIARHPGAAHNFPYAYRLAVPWLVHVLPLPEVASFTLIGLVCVGVASGALHQLLREFHITPWLATGLVVGFALSPTLWVVIVRHFRSIDPASMLVMVLGTLFIVRHQRRALLVTLLIGAAVRESTLFLIPFAYAVWAERPIDAAALRDVLYACLVPAVLYIIIRSQVHIVDEQFIPGYRGPFLNARIDLIKAAPAGIELRRLAYTYGPLWLVAPLALTRSRFARSGLVLVLLCVAAMSYAYDWGRIIFLAAPVFYVAAGQVLGGRRTLALVVVATLLAVDLGYGAYLQVDGVRHGLDNSVSPVPVR